MIDNDNQNESNEHEFDQIDYKSLSHALADCINVLTKHKLFKHPLIYKLSQRIININRTNE